MKSRLILLRNIFLVLFILTIIWLCNSVIAFENCTGCLARPQEIYISLFTAVITFLGFLSTAIIAIRREKREARDAELSRRQKEIELEKARLELEQLKKQVIKKKK